MCEHYSFLKNKAKKAKLMHPRNENTVNEHFQMAYQPPHRSLAAQIFITVFNHKNHSLWVCWTWF